MDMQKIEESDLLPLLTVQQNVITQEAVGL